MIKDFRVLLRVKQLKEDKALKALNDKRAEVVRCQAELAKAQEAVAESTRTLVRREDAIYQTILGNVVEQPDIDIVKDKVKVLHALHQNLVDKVAELKTRLATLNKQLEELREQYRLAHRNREKYAIMLETLTSEHAQEVERREENEIEELFTKGMKEI